MSKNPSVGRYLKKPRTKRPGRHSKLPNKHKSDKPYNGQGK